MFKFWQKKENKDDQLYPSFRARLLSALIDIALAALISFPILTLTSSLIYRDKLPSQKLGKILEAASKEPSFAVALSNNTEYQTFMSDYGYSSIFIEQVIQLFLFGLAIFIFWIKKYATPGKMLLFMKIVDHKTLKEPSIFQLIVRICAYIISCVPLGLGIFHIAFNKKRRAWHDIISGTLVVKKKELEEQMKI